MRPPSRFDRGRAAVAGAASALRPSRWVDGGARGPSRPRPGPRGGGAPSPRSWRRTASPPAAAWERAAARAGTAAASAPRSRTWPPRRRRRQQPRRVAELGVGAAGDHVPQIGQLRVRAVAGHVLAEAEPEAPAEPAAEELAERDVVDAGTPDALQPTGVGERLAAHQHAAAGRRGGPALRAVDPAEWVQHREEVDERRHDQALPAVPRPQ